MSLCEKAGCDVGLVQSTFVLTGHSGPVLIPARAGGIRIHTKPTRHKDAVSTNFSAPGSVE